MADNKAHIRISKELAEKLDGLELGSRNQAAETMIEKALNPTEGTGVELDNSEKQPFFKHLSGGKGEEYKADLMALELTEQELIDMAIAKSGKRFDTLMKEALISYSKEQITHAARRDYMDQTSDGSPEKRLQEVFADLTNKMMEGTYRPRGGRLNVSAVSQRAGVNYNTAKKWALENQPELLE
jgi:hypothetical protein